ncbi:hypothetical protein COB55_02475 [Candidatus Wolfebacteria bacterium]|nr:MAG: hypothetical protein COB55_02475 [Candidatus Wolfebacteria bacterium]
MRVEPYTVGSFVHVIKRGGRGMPIVKDESDKWRFLRSLYYLNDEYFNEDWANIYYKERPVSQTNRSVASAQEKLFYRPSGWPKRKPLVRIHAVTLVLNHFHLLLEEIKEGGVSLFMQKLGQSMTNHHNEKYHCIGSLFQGSFKSKTVDTDTYMSRLAVYIMVKNTFEVYDGGLDKAKENFDDAWEWSIKYPFSSLGDYAGDRKSPIVDTSFLKKFIGAPAEFKKLTRAIMSEEYWEDKVYIE